MDLPTTQDNFRGPHNCLHSPGTFINFVAENYVLLCGEAVAWTEKEARMIKHLSPIQWGGEYGGAQSLSPEHHHLHCLVWQRVVMLKITFPI